jgi:hypothetical protein
MFDKLFTHATKRNLEITAEFRCPGVYLSIELRKPSMVTEK